MRPAANFTASSSPTKPRPAERSGCGHAASLGQRKRVVHMPTCPQPQQQNPACRIEPDKRTPARPTDSPEEASFSVAALVQAPAPHPNPLPIVKNDGERGRPIPHRYRTSRPGPAAARCRNSPCWWRGAYRPSSVGAGLAAAAGFLLAAERAADLGARGADIDVGDAAVGARGATEELRLAQVVGEDRRRQALAARRCAAAIASSRSR